MQTSGGRFSLQRLRDEGEREVVAQELKGKKWVVRVTKMMSGKSGGSYGFCEHADFPENIFFLPWRCGLGKNVCVGATMEVEVGLNQKKDGGWGYIATACKVLSTPDTATEQSVNGLPKHGSSTKKRAQTGKERHAAKKRAKPPVKRAAQEVIVLPNWEEVLQRMKNKTITEDEVMNLVRRTLFYCRPGQSRHKKLADELSRFAEQVETQLGQRDLAVKILAELNQVQQSSLLNTVQPIKVSDWCREETRFTVCIDEQFPSLPHKTGTRSKRTGVIAGIVWAGKYPDPDVLPIIPDHCIQGGNVDPLVIDTLRGMLTQPRVFPFIMPITVSKQEGCASRHYSTLVKAAIKLLLGWLLPTDGAPAKVEILCDRYSDHPHKYRCTDYFRGMLDAPRFRRWELENVQWLNTDKVDSYIPYADMLAYLVLDRDKMAGMFDYKAWPGYVPLNLELVPRLEDIERIDETGAVSVLLDVGRDIAGTRLLEAVLARVKRKIGQRHDLHAAALAELDRRYLAKERDLRALEDQLETVVQVFGAPGAESTSRVQLVWKAIQMQKANHHGDPLGAADALKGYGELRHKAVENGEFELVVHCDLNMAVSLADQFRAEEALVVLEQARNTPAGLVQRGKLASARGQVLSMLGRYQEAEEHFVEALERFAAADVQEDIREQERDQTAVYRAINALDGTLAGAVASVEAVLGAPVEAARRLAGSLSKPYHHHLLLRAGYHMPEVFAEAMAVVRSLAEQWRTADQHPWELICCYRGLLMRDGTEEGQARAMRWFQRGVDMIERGGHTINMIRGMIMAVAACCGCAPVEWREDGKRKLEHVVAGMPSAAPFAKRLAEIFDQPSPERIDEALTVLPFNYH